MFVNASSAEVCLRSLALAESARNNSTLAESTLGNLTLAESSALFNSSLASIILSRSNLSYLLNTAKSNVNLFPLTERFVFLRSMMNTDHCFQSMQSPAQEGGKEMGSTNVSLLQMRAKAFHRATMELLIHVISFESEASKATPLLLGLDHHKQLVKQLLDHLQDSLSEVYNMELKLAGMTEVIKTILTDNCAKKPTVLDTPTFEVEDADDPEDSTELPEHPEYMMSANTQFSESQSLPDANTALGEQHAAMTPASDHTIKELYSVNYDPEDSTELPEHPEYMMSANTQFSESQSLPDANTALGEQHAAMTPASDHTWTKELYSVNFHNTL
ncbi:hypothetical protein EGW08_012062 [Elysia chlorotica]|uniref:Uncharacterized protein n=1 Tax=Elysia chlorotica TaxID=188477 RepID=A0A3S1C172_ELYCH|nr:hypothetical protein EGW08_012062 [Elysia chlorotica]